MLKIQRIFLTTFLLGLAVLLSGCKMVLLDTKGMIAAGEKNILITSAFLMLVVVIPVVILNFVFAWRYRENNRKATYAPNWSHSTLLEIIWWSIPCIIIIILGTITWISSHTLDPYKPIVVENRKPITIQAIALEWKWLFIYPEQHIATVNFVQIPAGVPIEFLITAEGPMNSFLVPQLAGQIYAMAGMQTKLHLITDNIGDYQGISANFSGDGFSDMKFIVRASTQSDFDHWVKQVKQAPNNLTMAAYEQLMQPSTKEGVKYFSSADKTIFTTVVMKAMMPMKMNNHMVADKASSSTQSKLLSSKNDSEK